MPLVNRLKTCTHSSVWMVWCMRVCEAAPCYAHSWMLTSCRKPKFHLDRFVSTRHIRRVEPMHFGCVELVEQHCSSRRARHVERVMSCRDVTWRAKWNLGYTVLGHWAFRWPYCLLRASKYSVFLLCCVCLGAESRSVDWPLCLLQGFTYFTLILLFSLCTGSELTLLCMPSDSRVYVVYLAQYTAIHWCDGSLRSGSYQLHHIRDICGWRVVHTTDRLIGGATGAREGRVRGSADPLKFWAEVRLRLGICRTGVSVMTTCLTASTISRGGVKISVSCYMIKLVFFPWPPLPLLKYGSRAPGVSCFWTS